MNGRKRHILVDTMGLLLAVVVHAADIQDRDGAKLLFMKILGLFPRLQLIWADGGYAGQLLEWVENFGGWVIEIVNKDPKAKGFQVLPRRSRSGTHVCLAGTVPSLEQRLRVSL